MSTWTSFVKIWTVSNCEFNLMANIWEKAFQFWWEIWIRVVVILLQLYIRGTYSFFNQPNSFLPARWFHFPVQKKKWKSVDCKMNRFYEKAHCPKFNMKEEKTSQWQCRLAMAIRVVEFSNEGYKIRKMFA